MGSTVSKSTSTSSVQVIDGFTLGSHVVDLSYQLGHGSFGVVYSGQAIKSGERVAVKKLEILTDERGERALEEIKKYDKLRAHPNLVNLIDYHFKSHAFWLVMEYCSDGNLDEFVFRYNPTEMTQYKFMLQCAQGIAHMHSADNPMAHRDVKPANIMLTRAGDNLLVKLTDFGLATDTNLSQSVQMKSKVGTPAFMAPEIYEQKPYTASVDVFALGLVFLGMILHENGQEILMPQIEGRPNLIPVGLQMIVASNQGGKQPVVVSVDSSDDKKSKAVKTIINKMVVKEPNQRISAHEVVKALESVAERGNISATSACKKAVRPKTGGRRDMREKQPKKPEKSFHETTSARQGGISESEESVDVDDALRELLGGMAIHALVAHALGGEESDDEDEDSDDEGDQSSHDEEIADSDDDNDNDDVEEFEVGDVVRIESDEEKAKQLQEGHGGWRDRMKKYLGKVGIVKLKLNGNVFVVQFIDTQRWGYSPAMLHKLDDNSEESLAAVDAGNSRFKRLDIVVVSEDEEKVKLLQKGHGEWIDEMAKSTGLKGIVHNVDSDGDVFVEFINQDKWTINPDALELVDPSAVAIRKGSLVIVLDDGDVVRQFQDDKHGEWNDAMISVLGHAGIVTELLTVDCVKVKFGEQTWTMNTAALKHVATEGEIVAAVLRKILT